MLVEAAVYMDPFKDCLRIYSKHFTYRMEQRHVPRTLVEKILSDGDVVMTGTTCKVTLGRHRVVLVRYTCRLILKTVTVD